MSIHLISRGITPGENLNVTFKNMSIYAVKTAKAAGFQVVGIF